MPELENPVSASVPSDCNCCFIAVSANDQFCQACGFPLQGSQEEQSQFFYKRNYQHLEMDSLKKKISSAGTTLYVLAGLFMLSGLVFFLANKDDNTSALLITNAVIAVIFVVLGYWAEKKPLASIISGMVLYVLVQLMALIENPRSLFSGLIVKIIVISYLVKGLLSALEAEKIKKQHNI